MRRTNAHPPIGMIGYDELLSILNALHLARPDLAEGFYLIAAATGMDDCFAPDPVIVIERTRRPELSEGVIP